MIKTLPLNFVVIFVAILNVCSAIKFRTFIWVYTKSIPSLYQVFESMPRGLCLVLYQYLWARSKINDKISYWSGFSKCYISWPCLMDFISGNFFWRFILNIFDCHLLELLKKLLLKEHICRSRFHVTFFEDLL